MISPAQRELRRRYIGSSDMAAILGLDPFKSGHDVYLDKTGRAADFAGNAATERGNLLEPVLIDWAELQLNQVLSRSVFFPHPAGLPVAANLDACGYSDKKMQFIVEAKTTTQPDEWGQDGSDEVPERVIVQTHVAMLVTGCRLAYVPVLLPAYQRFDFRMYRVERNDELAEVIAQKACEWWERHVKGDCPPSDSMPSLEVLKRVKRQPNKTVPIADELVDAWVAAKAAKKQAEDDCEKAQAAVLAALGDAEAGSYFKGEVTYLETTRKGYVVEPATFRTLRIRKAR